MTKEEIKKRINEAADAPTIPTQASLWSQLLFDLQPKVCSKCSEPKKDWEPPEPWEFVQGSLGWCIYNKQEAKWLSGDSTSLVGCDQTIKSGYRKLREYAENALKIYLKAQDEIKLKELQEQCKILEEKIASSPV